MNEKIIASGAEALIIKDKNSIIKRRIKKSYRINEIDKKLRLRRTRMEGKIIEKAGKIINCPKIIKIDEKEKEIDMEFIDGRRLSDNLDDFNLKYAGEICFKIGKSIAKLHNSEIIHGDLTTSNMILKDNKIFFIDFGLSFHSKKIEDKAVDLHLFRQALESKHFKNWGDLWKHFLEGYKEKNKESDKVLKQLEKVEKRGRYKGKH